MATSLLQIVTTSSCQFPCSTDVVAGLKPEVDSKNYDEDKDVLLYANLTATTAHG